MLLTAGRATDQIGSISFASVANKASLATAPQRSERLHGIPSLLAMPCKDEISNYGEYNNKTDISVPLS